MKGLDFEILVLKLCMKTYGGNIFHIYLELKVHFLKTYHEKIHADNSFDKITLTPTIFFNFDFI